MQIQNVIKEYLTAIDDAGMIGTAYSAINFAATIIAGVLGIWHGKKLRLGIIAVLMAVAAERLLSTPLMTLILFVENGFAPTETQNAVVVFPYIPLIGFVISKILRRSWKEIWDVMMPVPLVAFVGARIACTVTGCCYGYPCEWGIFNVNRGEYLFPIQLLESLATILILIAVIRREKKNNYVSDGRNVPIILISYGIARFFLEFLHDNKKIVLGCASTSFHCLFMIFVGVVTLKIIRKSERETLTRIDAAINRG